MFPAGTCARDQGLDIACPSASSFGYRCVGQNTPAALDPALTCTPATGDGDFCCTI
jgi:hypothetical protein